MKLVLDTNVFNNLKFSEWLLNTDEEKYLPAFAYMEYLYHNLKRRNTESMVNTYLKQMNVTIIPFGKDEALEAAKRSISNWDFSENARDYAIGATAIKLNAKLVTYNLKDFKWIKNVNTPEEVMGD